MEVGLQGQVQIGERLGLDALGRIHQQDRALAGRQGARDLVGEVDVAGGVDHVEGVGARLGASAHRPGHAHGLRLDGDAALTLDVHAVQVLGSHGAFIDHFGELQHSVGESGFAVVDVSDDAEIADDRRIGPAGCWHPSSL